MISSRGDRDERSGIGDRQIAIEERVRQRQHAGDGGGRETERQDGDDRERACARERAQRRFEILKHLSIVPPVSSTGVYCGCCRSTKMMARRRRGIAQPYV